MSLSPVSSLPLSRESMGRAFALTEAEIAVLLNPPPIDHRLLLQNCMGKGAFAASLLDEFTRTAIRRIGDFEHQSERGDFVAVAELSHGLRGVADILCASALSKFAIDTEAACRSEDLARMRQLISQLCKEVERVQLQIPSLSKTLIEEHHKQG